MTRRRANTSHRWLVISLSLFCVALIAGGIWLFLVGRSGLPALSYSIDLQLDPAAVAGAPDGVSKKERAPGDGMFGYRINLTPTFSAEDQNGDLALHNPSFNSYILVVELCLSDSEQVIYRSQYIPPNYHLPAVRLKTDLAAGSYPAVAYLNLIDPKTMQLADIVEQPLTLKVT